MNSEELQVLRFLDTYIRPDIIQVIFRVVVVEIVWLLDLQLPEQSVPIASNVVSSNPAHDEMCPLQHYVIKFVSDLRQVADFLHQ